ncbi:hypothetical protein ES708_18810 [subsurface metagenome]
MYVYKFIDVVLIIMSEIAQFVFFLQFVKLCLYE